MREVLVEFVSRLPRQVAQLEEFTRDGRVNDLCRLVHQIKGAGGGFGFAVMTRLAAQTEASIKASQSIEMVQNEIDQLIDLIRRVDGYDTKKENAHAAEAASY